MSVIKSQALIDALQIAKKPVYWLRRNGERVISIAPAAALTLARLGSYEGIIRSGRLRSIRELDPRTQKPWTPCWRNQEAAVLPPSATYLQSLSSIPAAEWNAIR